MRLFCSDPGSPGSTAGSGAAAVLHIGHHTSHLVAEVVENELCIPGLGKLIPLSEIMRFGMGKIFATHCAVDLLHDHPLCLLDRAPAPNQSYFPISITAYR